jgi:urease gamma subunit
MTNAMKGVLLSALVFPGLGQIVLKRYQRGVVLMLATVVGLVVIVVKAAREAGRILETIEAGGGVIDQDAMSRAIEQATAWSGNLAFNLLLVAITLVWIYSAVDAYRIGKQQDLGQQKGKATLPG